MSPEEWLAQQGAGQKPTRVLSPEEWLAQQGGGQPTSRALSPEEWLAQQDEKPTGTPGFIPSIVRGGRGLASLATDIIPAMVGKAIGQDEYAKQQLAEAAAYQKETERLYPAEVASYKDIKGVGDALTYVKEAIGEAIPSLIPSLVTGGVGGIAARGATAAATQAAERLAAQEVARAATKNVLTKETLDSIRDAAIDAGAKEARKIALKYQVAGSRVGAAAQTIPAAYQDIYEATGQEDLGTAIVTGGFNAALEAILPSMLLSKATKTGIGPEELAAAWYKRAGKGAAKGFVTEGGTEALQEVSTAAAEKFVDNNQEFFSEKNFERFLNSGLKGGFGGAGITAATDVAFGKGPEAQQKPTTRKTILDRLAGEEDVARIDEPTGGEGAGVVGEPGAQRPAGGVGGIEPSGVVLARPDVGRPDQRKEQPAAALTPEALDDFTRQYNDLRQEANEIYTSPSRTAADTGRERAINRDLANLIDANINVIGDVSLARKMKNLAFDANRELNALRSSLEAAPVGEARAMQGNLYGADPAKVSALLKTNMGLASQNPAKAIELLEAQRAKDLADQASGKHDANWAGMKANYFGFNRGEAARNPTEISRLYMEQQNKDIDTAIKTLQDRMGQPRAMQGDMFAPQRREEAEAAAAERQRAAEEQKATLEARAAEREAKREEIGAPIEGEPVAEEAAPEAAAEVVTEKISPDEAPKVTTEHIVQTAEGAQIKDFFDAIQPSSATPAEQAKHATPKNSATEALLEFDITKPGEATSPGVQAALRYLANRVGGMESFQELLSKLKGAPAELQSGMFKRAGLPDLTTRRGMEEFSSQVDEYISNLPGKSAGVKISKQSAAAPATGVFRGVMPYTEEVEQFGVEALEYAPFQTGEPRRPALRQTKKTYKLSDTKARSAVRVLREMLNMGAKLTRPARAAATYLRNTNREFLGQAIRDVAFDIAMYETDPGAYPANGVFKGEGGAYALDFQAWIEQNLDAGTVELLNDLIKDYKDTAANDIKFERLEKAYTAANEQAKVRIAQTEKFYGRKIPKTPKERRPASEKVRETEVGEQEGYTEPEISAKNIPREQVLYEVHPAIKRAIAEGDTTRVLELMAEAKGNPYYAALAQRLLDANVTAKLEVIGTDEMMPLTNDPAVPDTMTGFLVALKDLVITTLPKNRHAELVRQLESGKQRDIVEAINTIGYEAGNFTEGQKQLQKDAAAFYNNHYVWVGKYVPATDTIYIRTNSLTNHAFLHEALHAALSYLISNPDMLTGIRKQGYDQLNELFNHAKGMLSLEGLTDSSIYGLTDLHEFVSEAMTNPRFQATLRAIRYKASPYSLMNRFTQAVRKLFNIAEGPDSNVLNEVIFAADAMMMGGTAGKESMAGAPMALKNRPTPTGRPDSKSTIKNMMTSRSWSDVQSQWPVFYASLKADLRPIALGGLTTRQLADLVNKRIPQIDNFVRVAEDYLTRKNKILSESGDISKSWQRLQSLNPDMSRNLGGVMHKATIDEIDPDRATTAQKNLNVQLMQDWNALSPEAKQIYRAVRNFYEKRFSEYKRTLNNRVQMMRKAGVSEATISDIRKEFEKTSRKGPYFPLMRYGRFWYQVGKGDSREYYMFETLGEKEQHLRERLERNPELAGTLNPGIGDDYQRQMDHNARDSAFLKAAFAAVDSSNMLDKQNLKDELYQTWLANQPETSFRNRFIHRKAVEGFSQDALRNFASSSFHMAYQMSRFEYSPELFSQIQAAKAQLKMRELQGDPANVKVMRENNELGDYVRELDRRLETILNPEDVGTVVSMLSNVGFIYYLTSVASAATNIIGGMAIGLPTLIGHQIRMNPNMSYSSATVKALGQMKTVAMEIVGTGFGLERGPRLRDNMVLFPSLDRSSTMSALDRAAYDKFVGDGLIDITAAYDQSGLASTPTESYNGIRHRSMQAIAALFHNAERFNREVVAMSAFRAGMEKRAGYKNQQQAFTESIADAKDVTNQSMFDYSTANKPRYMQHPIARVVLQFKQFPQQMTFYLARNLVNMVAKPTEDQMVGMSDQERKKFLENHAIMKREATARFVGTMGMTAIFAGSTGLWGFSTAGAIINAVMNGLGGDDEEPFDFELEYTNWAVNTFGKNFGMFMARGAGNAAGIDLHSRVSLDGMWFRDGRKNLDEAEAWQQFLVDMLGPTAGLTVNMARAVDLYNKGQADRALETVAPGFLKQPLIAARYAREGVQTQKGDALVESVGPMDLLMQSLGFRPALIAEIQYYNITKKGQEQKILKERQNLLNLFGISFMANDADANEKAFEKIMKFNDKYTSARIPMGSITKSIKERMTKSAKAEHGMHIDKRLQGLIDETYIERLANEE